MISVVVPVFNEEKFLPDCLGSLSHQDYPGGYEIIVVDNGSTDGSVGIARGYGARVVFSPVPRSVFFARQFGAQQASGEIIAQADADTVYPEDWLSRITRRLASDSRAVAVAGTFEYKETAPLAGLELFLRNLGARASLVVYGRPFLISGANFAFRRQAFLHAGGYDLGAYAPDQYGIVTQLSRVGRVLYDQTLIVSTSPRRRRQKPRLTLVREAVGHILYGTSRLLLSSLHGLPRNARKPIPERRHTKVVSSFKETRP